MAARLRPLFLFIPIHISGPSNLLSLFTSLLFACNSEGGGPGSRTLLLLNAKLCCCGGGGLLFTRSAKTRDGVEAKQDSTMGMGSNGHNLVLKLLCGALLLFAESARVQGRPMLSLRKGWWGEGDALDIMWGREGEMEEVVHESRRLQTGGAYCVASASADASKLQDALDWACGPSGSSGGGVDCSAILQTGSCYSPDTLQAHASYAFNYYYVQQNGAADSCDFGGLATPTSTDPSSGSCVYPSLGSGVSSTPPASNFSSPTGGNSTSFGSPTSGSVSNGIMDPRLSWRHVHWSLLLVSLLASQL